MKKQSIKLISIKDVIIAVLIILVILFVGIELISIFRRNTYTVRFYDTNGGLIASVQVKDGEEAVYTEEIPSKEGDVYVYYVFDHWENVNGINATNVLKEVRSNLSVFPYFKQYTREYEVNFYDEDMTTLLESNIAVYGHCDSPTEKTKERWDAEYYYNFEGWADIQSGNIVNLRQINNNVNVYPVFKQIRLVEHINGIYYQYTPLNNTYSVIDADSTVTSAHIPSSVNNVDVVTISPGSFVNCKALTSVIIPKTVSQVYSTSFVSYLDYSSSIISIVVEDGNTIYDSRGNCNAIIKTSTNELILGCKNTTIPNDILSIGYMAFKGNQTITNINIPNSVVFVGERAFEDCSSLERISLPKATLIDEYAFKGCASLVSIEMPKVTLIEEYAFMGCAFTSVLLPSDVSYIGDAIFTYCDKLEKVYYEGNSSDWDNVEKGGFFDSDILYFYVENEEDVPSDGGNYWHYDEDGVAPIVWTVNE